MAASKKSSPTGAPGEANVAATKQIRDAMAAMLNVSLALERSFSSQASSVQKMAEELKKMNTGDLAEQTKQLTTAIDSALKSIEKLAGNTSSALAAAGTAAGNATGSVRNLGSEIARAGKSADAASTSTENFGDILGDVTESSQSLNDKLQKIGKYLKKEHPVAVGAALGAMSGLMQGFRNVMALGKAVFGVFESIVGVAFDLATAIIAIPFKIFDGLIDMAKKNAGQMSELAQAIEKVRENFGALSNTTPKAIFGTARALGNLKLTGVSAFQVFGTLAERIEKLNALFMAGGPAIRNLSNEFVESGGALLGYQKGLGLSDEMMGNIAQKAQSIGKPMGKILNDITKQSLHLGDAFKLDAKIISREMGKAAMDMKHFGDVSIKQIGVAVTYAHKLGIDLDKITGIMDQFSTFDSAAENVSKLNTAFGTNINAMQMLEAESPAEQLEILRKEFARVGVEGENLNRHYRALITSATTLSDADIKAAFSSKNQGIALKGIQKESEKAEKKTLTQAEAMSKLSNAMERMIKSMDLAQGGFFSQFVKGITDGIAMSEPFRKLLQNIYRSLTTVYMEGRRLGLMFVELFPGLKDMIGGLGDLFSPAKFKKLFGGVTDVIIEWMRGLSDPNRKFSFGALMEKIQEKFLDFFNSEKPAGAKVVNGFKKIMETISNILAEAAKWVIETMTGLIRGIVDFIRDPKKVPGAGDAGSAVMSFFMPIVQAISDAWPPLWEALKDLFSIAFEKLFAWAEKSLWPIIQPYMPYIAGGLALVLFGPVVAQAMLGAFIGMMTPIITQGLMGALTKAGSSGKLGEFGKKLAEIIRPPSPVPAGGGPAPTTPEIPAVPKGAKEAGEAKINWNNVIKFLVGLALVITIGMVAFFTAIGLIRTFKVTTEEILQAGAMLVTIGVTAVLVGIAAKLISMIKVDIKSVAMGLLAVAVVGAALIGLGWLLSKVDIDLTAVMKGSTILLAAAGAALVVGLMTIALMGLGLALAGPQVALVLLGIGGVAVVGAALVKGMSSLVDAVSKGGFSVENLELSSKVLTMSAQALKTVALAMAVSLGASVFSAISKVAKFFGATDPFEQLTSIVDKIVGPTGIARKVIDSMSGLVGDEVGKKVELMMKILDAVSNLMRAVSDIFGKASLSAAAGVLSKSQAPITELNTLIGTVIGNPTQKTGIIGIIDKVIEAVKAIGESNETLQAAGSLASILSAVAEVAKAMSPPDSFMEALKTSASTWGEDSASLMHELSVHTATVGAVLTGDKGLLAGIKALISDPSLNSMSEEKLKGIEAIGKLMSSLGPIAQALSPPPHVMDMLKVVASTWGENTTDTLKSLGDYAKKVGDVLTGPNGAIASIGKALTGLFKALGTLKLDDSQVKFVEAMAPLLKTMFETMASLMSVAPAATKMKPDEMKALSDVLEKLKGTMSTFLDGIKNAIPEMVKGVVAAIGEIGSVNPKKLEAGMTMLKGVFALVAEIPKLFGVLSNMGGTGKSLDIGTSNDFIQYVKNVGYVMKWLVLEKRAEMNNMSVLGFMTDILKSKDVMGLSGAKTGAASLKSMFELIKTIIETASSAASFGGKEGFSAAAQQKLIDTFVGIAQFFKSLTTKGLFGLTNPPLQIITDAIRAFEPMSKGIQAGIPPLKKIFEFIGEMIGIVENYSGKGKTFDGEMAKTNITNVSTLFSQILGKGLPLSVISDTIVAETKNFVKAEQIVSVKQALEEVLKAGQAIKNLPAPKGFTEHQQSIAEVKQFLVAVLQTNEGGTARQLQGLVTEAQTLLKKTIRPTIDVIDEIMKKAMELQKKLTAGKDLNVDAALRVFAGKSAKGIGVTGNKYIVGAQPVAINVNFAIAIDAKELERVLVQREDSIVRDRVNYLLGLTVGNNSKNVFENQSVIYESASSTQPNAGNASQHMNNAFTNGQIPNNPTASPGEATAYTVPESGQSPSASY
jgi:hypothetical protein